MDVGAHYFCPRQRGWEGRLGRGLFSENERGDKSEIEIRRAKYKKELLKPRIFGTEQNAIVPHVGVVGTPVKIGKGRCAKSFLFQLNFCFSQLSGQLLF